MLAVNLSYISPETGRRFCLATVLDPVTVRRAAAQAVREAERRAAATGEVDQALGAIEREEAVRLRRTMALFRS
jgi:hypothetical protein